MVKLFVFTTLVSLFSTTAIASTLDIGTRGSLTFGITEHGVMDVFGRYHAYRWNYGDLTNVLSITGGYTTNTENVSLGFEYIGSYQISEPFSVYGSLNLDYNANRNLVTSGYVTVTPALGLEYVFTPSLTAFGEVGYSFDATNSWSRMGGYGQLGLDYAVTSSFSLRPSVIRTFDTGSNFTSARLEAVIRF
jgi:hypothetical protein